MDVVDSKTGDRDAGGGVTSWGAVLVVLLDNDTVIGDAREGDVFVGDAGDGSRSIVNGLDADTVRRVANGG